MTLGLLSTGGFDLTFKQDFKRKSKIKRIRIIFKANLKPFHKIPKIHPENIPNPRKMNLRELPTIPITVKRIKAQNKNRKMIKTSTSR